jgi:hypothetical protein
MDRAMLRGSPLPTALPALDPLAAALLRTGLLGRGVTRGGGVRVVVGFGVTRFGAGAASATRVSDRLAAVVVDRGDGAAVGDGDGGSAEVSGSTTAGRASAAGVTAPVAAGSASLPPPAARTIAMPTATVTGAVGHDDGDDPSTGKPSLAPAG